MNQTTQNKAAAIAPAVSPRALFLVVAALVFCMALLTGCGSSSSSDTGGSKDSGDSSAETVSAEDAEFHVSDLGNGWEVQDSMKLEYANQFTVDYYKGGYKLACLSDGARYLLVPKGAKVPKGIDKDIVVLQQPLKNIYLVASDTMCLIEALDVMDAVTVSGISKDGWYVKSARKAMEDGKMAYGGKYSAPDYELLKKEKVELAIESTMINHTPEVRDKLIELDIPVLIEQSSYESEPLGRCEWVKFYGALFDKEDLAAQLFEEQVSKANKVKGAETGKTVAFFYINSNGAAVVRKPGDYVTKMIDIAGGNYIFESLDSSKSGMSTVTLEMEQFYAQAKDVDVVIYNATIDSGVTSVADLVAKNPLLEEVKAVKDGNVWVTEQNMYQQMMNTGDIISDFNDVFSGTTEDLTYLHRLT